ncbi:MAG: hypothetical protein V3W45_04385, partial [Sedimentisphaerales bacterium]
MSTLTKILIVLLTVSSIFLCGIVVTWVANADSYKQKYDSQIARIGSLTEELGSLKKQLNRKIEEKSAQKAKLSNEIATLKVKSSELLTQLKTVEAEKSLLLQKVNNWTSVVEAFSQTADNKELLLKDTLGELNRLKQQQIQLKKELDETTAFLEEKMVIIASLQNDKRQLLEGKTDLQRKLDRLLLPTGRVALPAAPVTTRRERAKPAAPIQTKDINLLGLVTSVDLKNSMAGISIGAADGVMKNMKFHITRGDEFICDIIIT